MVNQHWVGMRFVITKSKVKTFFLFSFFFFLISPVLYLSKFDGAMGLGTSVLIVLLFALATFFVTDRDWKRTIALSILFASMLPNEIMVFLLLPFFFVVYVVDLLVTGKLLGSIDRYVFVFLLYLTFLSLINFGRYTDVWSLPLYLTFYVMPIIFGTVLGKWFSDNKGLTFLSATYISMLLLQFIPVVFKSFVIGEPELLLRGDDLNHGTLIRAHYLGVLFAFFMIYHCFCFLLTQKKNNLFFIVIGFFGFLLTDSKHIWAAILPAGGVALLIVIRYLRIITPKRFLSIGFTFSILLFLIFQFSKVDDNRSSFSEMLKTLSEVGVTNKLIFFQRTIVYFQNHPVQMITGLGPGSYGSRVASARASDVLYKRKNSLPEFIPAFSSGPYRLNIKGLYLRDDSIAVRSKVLSNPFADIIGIVSELGLVGSFFFVMIYISAGKSCVNVIRFDRSNEWKALAITGLFSVPFIFILGIFATYFAQSSVIVPIWFMLGVIHARSNFLGKKVNGTSDTHSDI